MVSKFWMVSMGISKGFRGKPNLKNFSGQKSTHESGPWSQKYPMRVTKHDENSTLAKLNQTSATLRPQIGTYIGIQMNGHQDGPLKSHVIENKHLEQSVTIWLGYFHSFLTTVIQNIPNVPPCTYLKHKKLPRRWTFLSHKNLHFFTTKNRKINRKRFKMFKWR